MKRLPLARFFLIFACSLLLHAHDSQAQTKSTLGTGLRPETTDGQAWISKNLPRAKKVRANSLALARMNAERQARRLPLVNAASIELGRFGEEAVLGATTRASTTILGALPTSVDNSTLPAFPPIRSQGSIGSCASWATTYYQFTYENNLALGTSAKTGDNNYIFSPKWSYNMINGGNDAGSSFSANYQVLLNNGATKWAAFPYDTNYREWSLNPVAWQDAIHYRLKSQGSIYYSDSVGSDAMKQQLANGHILVFGTYITSFQYKTVANDTSTVNDDPLVGQQAVYYMNGTVGGHGMTIVGYNDELWIDINGNSVLDAGEKGAFKIANSWGTTYKNAGFVWVAYDALRTTSAVTSGPTSGRTPLLMSNAVYFVTAFDYTPQYIAQFTISHAKRNQLAVTLGLGETSSTTPTSLWYPGMLRNQGGSYSFNGTTTAVDATFALDFTSLYSNPVAGTTKRLFLNIADNVSGDPVTLKSFKILNGLGAELATASNASLSIDATTGRSYIDYTTTINGNYPPVASATATPTSGMLPLIVNFNAAASKDQDGSISAYAWDFGDGTSGAGVSVSHTYTTAGSFVAKLTVTDDKGAFASANIGIVATDPNVVIAPTSLTAKASARVVTLSWIDNSTNEEGYYVERSPKTTRNAVFARVATLPANSKSFSESLGVGTYYYRVIAFKSLPTVTATSSQVQIRVR